MGLRTGKASRLTEVLEVTPLGGRKFLYLVRVHDRLLVVGVTPDRISSISEIYGDEIIGLNRRKLKEVLEKDPLKKFLPK